MQASILALATLGIVLIFKTSFTTNFAQGSIAAFSAYVMYFVMHVVIESVFKIESATMPWYFYLVGMLAGIIVAFLIGLFVDTLIIRKAKYITSVGKQMITMGLVLILTALTDIIFGVLPKTIDRISYETYRTSGSFEIAVTAHELVSILLAVFVLSLLFTILRFTKWGLGVRATASNELVSSMMGINTRFITAMSWAVAGALGALAAALYANHCILINRNDDIISGKRLSCLNIRWSLNILWSNYCGIYYSNCNGICCLFSTSMVQCNCLCVNLNSYFN